MHLKDIMRAEPQPVYVLQAADRAILVSSVSCLSVEPAILTASIMKTEKNAPFLRDKETAFTLWRLSEGVIWSGRLDKKDLKNLQPHEYVWKANGLLWPLIGYGDHEIVTLEQMELTAGTGTNHLTWKNGKADGWV